MIFQSFWKLTNKIFIRFSLRHSQTLIKQVICHLYTTRKRQKMRGRERDRKKGKDCLWVMYGCFILFWFTYVCVWSLASTVISLSSSSILSFENLSRKEDLIVVWMYVHSLKCPQVIISVKIFKFCRKFKFEILIVIRERKVCCNLLC